MATSPATKPIQNVETPKQIRIIGVPLDLGQSRRGVDMGPSAVRVAGLESKLEALGYDVKDGGNVSVAVLETRPEGDPRAKYLAEITETCTKEAELVVKTLEAAIFLSCWAATTRLQRAPCQEWPSITGDRSRKSD